MRISRIAVDRVPARHHIGSVESRLRFTAASHELDERR
jgi:hypothetical protein